MQKDGLCLGGSMINNIYERPEVLSSLKKVFKEQGSVQMEVFLEPKIYDEVVKGIKKAYMKKVNVPLEGLYFQAPFQKKEITKAIDGWISALMEKPVKSEQTIFSFRHKDYTICSDEHDEKKGLMAFLEVTKVWGENWGGYTSFIKNNEEVFRIVPVANTLTLVSVGEKMKKFVKYVNYHAGKTKREYIKFFYEI